MNPKKTARRLLSIFGEKALGDMLGDNVYEFVNLMDQLLSMQEGGLRVEAPAIELSTAELIQQSALPADMLAWAHSCHKANTPCWNCRGCNKYRETYDEVSASMA